jgi:hypothetical protein
MADYRLYSLDGEGRINLADWIKADNDEQAIARARQLKLGARKCEIWKRNKLIATIEASGGERMAG